MTFRVALSLVIVILGLCGLAMPSLALGQGMPLDDWQKNHHVVILGVDSDVVYLGKTRGDQTLAQAMRANWEVGTVSRLASTGDALVMPDALVPIQDPAWAALGKLQHVAIHARLGLAVLSASRPGGRGDLDLFMSHRMTQRKVGVSGGVEVSWSSPQPLDGLNTTGDEVFPRWEGRDVVFASNGRSTDEVEGGSFSLYRSEGRHQWLRAEAIQGPWNLEDDQTSVAECVPGTLGLSQRLQGSPHVQLTWKAEASRREVLGEGWTMCVRDPLTLEPLHGNLEVRDSKTRRVCGRWTVHGCADVSQLDPTQPWVVRWNADELIEAEWVLVSPDGRIIRRHLLRDDLGWSFTMLPLDAVEAMKQGALQDASFWPWLEVQLVHFDLGSSNPQPASLRAFQSWVNESTSFTHHEAGRWLVMGHADQSGPESVNASLSEARAQVIAQELLLLFPDAKMVTSGAGSTLPVGNDPAQNRRVEVRWVPNVK
ncbi:MAG: OmpA family protein [Bacteroidetes bacterium]|nr:OmpA family protein [Bacteroidota bacterium]MDA0903383.1 OmpA family protein [Bacteroidota bacterium]MDA1241585.1 OmpA family protein [Bacteroidota bacterium]